MAEKKASRFVLPPLSVREKQAFRLLVLIVVLGLGLRLWGIGWSLPNAQHPMATYHPDELINLEAAKAADVPALKLDIGFYNYGTFYFYLVSFAHTFGRGWGLIPSTPALPADAPPLAKVEQMVRSAPEMAGLFLAGRLVTVLLGTLTIPVLFALGSRLYGKRVGLLAAMLYAIAPLAALHAHFLTVDVPATFFVTLALLQAARLLTIQTWRDYVLAGVWVGLAAATKYNAGLVFIAPVVAHLLNRVPDACQLHRRAHLTVMLIAVGFAFLIACPGPILNWDAFWNGLPGYPGSGVRYELLEHSRTGHGDLFTDTGPGWWYHTAVSLRFGLGLPGLLLAFAGFLYACYKREKQERLLLAFFLLYFVLTCFSAVRFARYMLPVLPVLCLWTARLLLASRVPEKARSGQLVFVGVFAAVTALYTLSLIRPMTLPDPRDSAAAYLNTNAKEGASIAFAKTPWFFSPPLSPLFGRPSAPGRAQAAQKVTRFALRIPAGEWDTAVLQPPPPDYIVLSNLETMNTVERLQTPEAVRFVSAIPNRYQPVIFAPPGLFPIVGSTRFLPEDFLYTMPTLTIFTPK